MLMKRWAINTIITKRTTFYVSAKAEIEENDILEAVEGYAVDQETTNYLDVNLDDITDDVYADVKVTGAHWDYYEDKDKKEKVSKKTKKGRAK